MQRIKEIKEENLLISKYKGDREYYEDDFLYCKLDYGITLLAVMDGHGSTNTNKYIKDNLPKILHSYIISSSFDDDSIILSLKNAILYLDHSWYSLEGDVEKKAGSTLVLAIIIDLPLYRKIVVGNVGDSRCVIFNGEGILLETKDHKPTDVMEMQRIRNAGGRVSYSGSIPRVSGFSLSRSIGDFHQRCKIQNGEYMGFRSILSPEPDIYILDLNNISTFSILMGTDGVFDHISSYDALNILSRGHIYTANLHTDLINSCLVNAMNSRISNDNILILTYGPWYIR
ncbi:Serine/threonine phosphatase 2C (PP2C) [Orpheovirus IHUMI-LCC2]|uniref:Serine/threonine phosphatase 2C (PP2C) n=1 Tax=Orpheovirus IHUMI-LCC2 TaxID=2023057 RepID=A0A2I2L5U7_9VIRU|nr:Serine/threonine phosphatase 2C (PP2C) [Orpheovirus IHUMI-LCC2]SNW62914.1 Serine/threonine phosphatase 2C (PP2C) [Orpheovirus IHUMI-LCC2]